MRRPGPRKNEYRRCEFRVGHVRCARRANWELGWSFLCLRHLRLYNAMTRLPKIEARRLKCLK